MLRYFSLILSLLFALCYFSAFGQEQVTPQVWLKGDDKEFSKLNRRLLSEWKNAGDCQSVDAATLARFTIDEKGNVDQITIYEYPGTPTLFREILIKVLQSTSGQWQTQTIDGKPFENQSIILPFRYHIDVVCDKLRKQYLGISYNELQRIITQQTPGNAAKFVSGCVILPVLSIYAHSEQR